MSEPSQETIAAPPQHATPAPRLVNSLTSGRVEAFSDGVFAIALTLLIFNIHVPSKVADESALLTELKDQWLAYVSYALSVIVVGVFWVAHHALFHFIRRADRPLFWLNIAFVGIVAFIPFPAAVLSLYGQFRTAVVLYSATMASAGIVLYLMVHYSCDQRRLVDPALPDAVVDGMKRRVRVGPAAYLLAIVISLLPFDLSSRIGLLIDVLVPIMYIVPGALDRHWRSDRSATSTAKEPRGKGESQSH